MNRWSHVSLNVRFWVALALWLALFGGLLALNYFYPHGTFGGI